MSDIPQPYPLAWPGGVDRTKSRITSKFKTTLNGALDNVRRSIIKFGKEAGKPVGGVVISSNVTLGANNPADPGIAVWFVWENEQRCIAVDRYTKVQDNVQAVHHILEARCTELRHGGLHVVRQTFKGFTALPAPGLDWRRILCFEQSNTLPSRASIDEKYRAAAAKAHPDKGGTADAMAEVNAAKQAALQAIGEA